MREPVQVPIPVLPGWVSLTWTPTRSGLLVWCDACSTGVLLYSTVLMSKPESLTTAVEGHRSCLQE